MTFLKRVDRLLPVATWIEKAAYGGINISSMALLVAMVLITANVLGRKLFKPVPGGFELSESLMIVIVFMSVAYVTLRHGHVNVNVATKSLPARAQATLDFLAAILGLIIGGIITWVSGDIAWHAWLEGECRLGLITVVVWPFRVFFCIGFGILTLAFALVAARELPRIIRRLP